MKLNLVIKERFGIIGLLNAKNQQGGLDLTGLNTALELNEKLAIKGNLSFDEDGKSIQTEEYKKFNIRQVVQDGKPNIVWDRDKDKGIDVDFSENEFKLIKELLQSKSDSKELGIGDDYAIALAKKLGIEG